MNIAIAAAAVFAAALATPATAQEVEVKFPRSMLHTDEGVAEIYGMFERDSARACMREMRNTPSIASVSSCKRELVNALVSDLGNRKVTDLHRLNVGIQYANYLGDQRH